MLTSRWRPNNWLYSSSFESIAEECSVTGLTVSKIWCNFCFHERLTAPLNKGGDFSSKLSDGDLELVELLKTRKGSTQLNEIYSVLEDVGDIEGSISFSTISRAIKSKLLSGGKKYTRKRITHVVTERFTDTNMIYMQFFINYLSSKDPRKLKFFDEAGVKTPDIGTRLYGNAPSGARCIEVIRKMESPNSTLNLLISLNEPAYFNILDGATNTCIC